MATGKVTAASNVAAQRQFSIPVVAPTQWSTICSDAMVADTVSPNPNPIGITRAAQNWFQVSGWTTLQIRLKYVGTPNPTSPAAVVHVYARDTVDATVNPQRLKDSSGAYNLNLSADTTNDVYDGTSSYSDWVEVDIQNSVEVIALVKTAVVSATSAVIQARVK